MRERFQNAPWWVYSLTMGGFFGAWTTVTGYLQHPGSWTRAIVMGLIQGVFFGAVMGPILTRQRRKRVAAIGKMSASDLRAAGRAAMRGPVPADPRIRRAAEWLATNQLNETSRYRWIGLIMFVFFTVASIAFALTWSSWWWLGALAMFSLSAWFMVLPRHLRRRIELLKLETS
jgi:general stress protein CsbA